MHLLTAKLGLVSAHIVQTDINERFGGARLSQAWKVLPRTGNIIRA